MVAIASWAKKKGLVYEKELLPVGRFYKWGGKGRPSNKIKITRRFIDRCVQQFSKFKKVGVGVRFFKTHVEDPDNVRGRVLRVFAKPNHKGKYSLFAHIEFNDEKARDAAIQNDVSVLCPEEWVDGKKNRYTYPLRHVASTHDPVVPGLKRFVPVVMSFDTPSGLLSAGTGDLAVSKKKWSKLLKLLGIKVDDDQSQDYQLDLVMSAVRKLGKGAAQEDDELDDDEEEDELDEDEEEEDDDELDDELDDSEEGATEDDDDVKSKSKSKGKGKSPNKGKSKGKPARRQPAMALSHSPIILNQFKRARVGEINAAVKARKISPVTAKELKKTYCSSSAIKTDLSLSGDSTETEFDRVFAIAKKAAARKPLEAQGRRIVKLAHNSSDDGEDSLEKSDNPLLRDVARRIRAAERNGRRA